MPDRKPKARSGGLVLTLDPQRIFIGLLGEHAGQVCLRQHDNTIRPATPAEIKLALLVCPALRRCYAAPEGLSLLKRPLK